MIGNPDLEEGESYIYEPWLDGIHDKMKRIYEQIKLIGGKFICLTFKDSDLADCEDKALLLLNTIEACMRKSILEVQNVVPSYVSFFN